MNKKFYLLSLLAVMLFAGCNTDESVLENSGASEWSMVGSLGKRVNAILVYNEDILIAGTQKGLFSDYGLYLSSNAGETWENIIEEDVTVNDIDRDLGNKIYASTEGAGVIFISDILQPDYQLLSNGLSSLSVNSIALDLDDNLYAANEDSGIFRYENDQFKLYKASRNPAAEGQIAVDTNGDIYFYLNGFGYFRINFDTKIDEKILHLGATPEHIFPLAGKLYIYVRYLGLFLYESLDSEPITGFIDSNITVHAMMRINGIYFMGCSVKGVLISNDGINWREFNEGLSSAEVTALTTYDGIILYAANSAGEIYKRRLE